MSMAVIGGALIVGGGTYMAGRSQKAPGRAAPIDVGATTRDSIYSNVQNAPEAEALTRRTNSFNQSEQASLLEKVIPGWSNISKGLAGMVEKTVANPYEVPKEFQDNLARISAERGINTGGRGQFQDFSFLRDLGINSFQMGEARMSQAQSIISLLSGVAKVNPLSPFAFYTTPGQALGAAGANQGMEQGHLNAERAAANARAASGWNALASTTGMLTGAYMSGAFDKKPPAKDPKQPPAGDLF